MNYMKSFIYIYFLFPPCNRHYPSIAYREETKNIGLRKTVSFDPKKLQGTPYIFDGDDQNSKRHPVLNYIY